MAKLKIFFLSALLLLFTTNISSASAFDSSINFDNVQLVLLDDEEKEEVTEEEVSEEETEEEVEEE